MQQDVIKNFFASCEGGYYRVTHVRVDWLWTSDVSGAIYKEGRPGRLHTSFIADLCTEDPELHPQFDYPKQTVHKPGSVVSSFA